MPRRNPEIGCQSIQFKSSTTANGIIIFQPHMIQTNPLMLFVDMEPSTANHEVLLQLFTITYTIVTRTFTPVVTTSSSAAGSMQKSTTFFTHLLTDEEMYESENTDDSEFCTDGSLQRLV